MTPISPLTAPKPAAAPRQPHRFAQGMVLRPALDSLRVAAEGDKQNPVAAAFTAFQGGLRWLINGPSSKEFKTREVVSDPDTRYADANQLRAAVANVKAKEAEERVALGKLGDRAETYRTMMQLSAQDPMAREALQRMLLDGRLTGSHDLKGGGDALSHLARLANGPLAPGLDRTDLLTSVIEEMENPTKLAQEGKGTCAATTCTVVMARKSPAEYARLIADLAAPAGTGQLHDGTRIARKADWNSDSDYGRTPSMRLLQPALMEVGNFFLKYDNTRDAHTLDSKSGLAGVWDSVCAGFGKLRSMLALPGGLEGNGINKLVQALTGDGYKNHGMVTRLNRDLVWHQVADAVAHGHSVPCGLMWEGGGHELLLDKIEGGFAYYNNPWGSAERMSVAEFRQNLNNANIPKGV